MAVLVSNFQGKIAVDDFAAEFLVDAVRKVLETAGYGDNAEVSLVFVDDEYMQNLNHQYRGLDSPTDEIGRAHV